MSLKLFVRRGEGGHIPQHVLLKPQVCLQRELTLQRLRDVHDVQTGETHMAMQILIFQSALVTPTGQRSHCVVFTHCESHLSKMKAISQRGQAGCVI